MRQTLLFALIAAIIISMSLKEDTEKKSFFFSGRTTIRRGKKNHFFSMIKKKWPEPHETQENELKNCILCSVPVNIDLCWVYLFICFLCASSLTTPYIFIALIICFTQFQKWLMVRPNTKWLHFMKHIYAF